MRVCRASPNDKLTTASFFTELPRKEEFSAVRIQNREFVWLRSQYQEVHEQRG